MLSIRGRDVGDKEDQRRFEWTESGIICVLWMTANKMEHVVPNLPRCDKGYYDVAEVTY